MRVLHVCLCGPFTDGMAYQENELVRQHVMSGNDVYVVTGLDLFGSDGALYKESPGVYKSVTGAEVVRIEYVSWLPSKVSEKVRAYKGLVGVVERIRPDVIFFHGLNTWELVTISRYVKKFPNVVFNVDTHADSNNSALNPISKWGLHKGFYRAVVKYSEKVIKRIFCCSIEAQDFVEKMYSVDVRKLEFLPLGGVLWGDEEYERVRGEIRKTQGWKKDNRVFLQSGKMGGAKKLLETLNAFSKSPSPNIRLALVGSIMPDIRERALEIIESDSRIVNFGWKAGAELRNLLCAADVYVQPGSQSATMQMALCCRCSVILHDAISHKIFVDSNGVLIKEQRDLDDSINYFAECSESQLMASSRASELIATKFLDYEEQAARVLV